MQIALFGATGGTGRQVVEQALAAGHHVNALVRDPAKLPVAHPNLNAIPGDVLDPAAVAATLQGSGAVIVTLGKTAGNPDRVVSEGTRLIVETMQRQGIRRLVVVTSLGVGDSRGQVPFYFKLLAKTLLRKVMQDKEAQESVVRASKLDWTIVRPGGLTDDPPTADYVVSTDLSLRSDRLARSDLAAFLLTQIQDTTYLHQTCAIT